MKFTKTKNQPTQNSKRRMAFKNHSSSRTVPSSCSSSTSLPFKFTTIITLVFIFCSSYYIFFSQFDYSSVTSSPENPPFVGDLRDLTFPWNKLPLGPISEKLKLAVFCKSWPVGSIPGGMERHAYTLYTSLASRGHEIHVFTVSSDKSNNQNRVEEEEYYNRGDLHIYFTPNQNGVLNCTHAFEIFHRISIDHPFDYVHTESVALPHWRVKMVPNRDVAVTWHGIWYEIMHSKLFQELYDTNESDLQQTMPRLVDEIKFFPSYKHHICISNSAREVLVNIYQLPKRNVHVIVNGVDHTKFVFRPESGVRFRAKHGIPSGNNGTTIIVMGVSGRLVRDKGHPLLYEAFALIAKTYPDVYLLVAGSGPWGKRYAELGQNVRVLGALEPEELSGFYNALDVFVNPTLRPQGLDLTIIEAMQCGKPVVTPNYPSIVGTVVVDERFGYTFSPNVRSLVETLDLVVRDGSRVLEMKGKACKEYALSMFTATQMASAYERFFMCMKNERYCKYPLPIDNY